MKIFQIENPMLKILPHFFLIMMVSGCFDRTTNISQICEDTPSICVKLNMNDGQCNIERTTLIRQRSHSLDNPSELNRFDELLTTKKYASCMELAAQIEVVTLKERKNQRTEALYHAYDSIELIETELTDSVQPIILYYRWSQGDNNALEQFLKLEFTQYLDTPQLQLALASYYTDKDENHTVEILLKALSLYDGEDQKVKEDTLPEILKSLATMNHSLGYFEHAYLWARVGQQFGVAIANNEELDRMYALSQERIDHLNNISLNIIEKIKLGKFTTLLLASIES